MSTEFSLTQYTTAAAFSEAAGELLRANPVQNRWLAGNLAALVRAEQRGPVQGAAFLL